MTKLTPTERVTIQQKVALCRKKLTLVIADLKNIDMYWDECDDARDAAAAAQYHWFGKDRIVLSLTWKDQLEDATPWVCHELRHRYQHQMWGWLYPLLANRWWGWLTIEPTAYQVENECLEILGMETGDAT